MENYLQKAWGDLSDNVSMRDVRIAIREIQEMDDEHGAFWVSVLKADESVLEVHKDLTLIGTFENEPEKEYRKQANDWNEIELLFEQLLDEKLDILKPP